MDPSGDFEAGAGAGTPRSGRPGFPVDPYRLRRALWSGRRAIVIVAAVGLVVGYATAKLFMGSAYETTAILKYEGDLDVPGLPARQDAIGPAAEALRNQAVLEEIRRRSGFPGGLTALSATIGYHVDFMAGTMHVSVSRSSAQRAADYVRLVTDVFLEYHKDRQSRRLDAELTRLRKRIEAADEESSRARKRYNEFREQHGIADLSTEQTSMLQSAAKLRADSELAVAEVRALEAEVASLEAQLASTPKTAFVGGGAGPERAAYDQLRGELASARATLSEDHPRVQALEQQVAQLRAQLRRGTGFRNDGLVGVNAAYQSVEARLRETKSRLAAAQARQRGLLEMAAKAGDRIESFSDVEGEAAGLLAEVKVNEALVGELRRTEAAIEDALRDPPSGFVVLDPGAVPEYPVRNKMKLVVFVAIPALAVGLVVLLLLRREFRGLRPITPAEVAFWGNGPVVGATSWPDDPHGLEELVAGLDDLAPDASGTMLVVGDSEADSALAAELAERMNEDWVQAGPHAPAPSTGPIPVRPPSGPYPVGGPTSSATALARRSPVPALRPVPIVTKADALELEAWDGPLEGQALRRAARLADRVVVLVRAGSTPLPRLYGTASRLGRQHGVGYLVLGLPSDLHSLPDRVGDVAGFWAVHGGHR